MLIEPYKSVGELLFIDTRQQIREKINEPFDIGVKDQISNTGEYDYFTGSGLFVYYDKKNNIGAFEFFESNPVFNNISLFSLSYPDLVSLFTNADPDIIVDYNTFTSNRFGIGASTNDDPEDPEAIPEAVIIFKKGYYDALLQ